MYYVYGLFIDDADVPFYIGKGHGDRALDHLGGREGGNSHKNHTILKAQREGKSINVKFLHETDSEQEAFSLEISEIKKYGRRCDGSGVLTNLTEGGEGPSGYKHTPEQVERNRRAQLGTKRSEATKLKMSQSHKGRKKSESHSAKISAGKKEYYANNPEAAKALLGAGNPNANMRPWESSITARRPLSMKAWAMAQELLPVWESGGRAALRKHFKVVGLGDTSEEGLHMRFKSGWRPLEDQKWVEWVGVSPAQSTASPSLPSC
jgi:hypothetical protein